MKLQAAVVVAGIFKLQVGGKRITFICIIYTFHGTLGIMCSFDRTQRRMELEGVSACLKLIAMLGVGPVLESGPAMK